MGIYYAVACDEMKERIDPGEINNLGMKEYAIAYPDHPFGALVIFAMLTRWRHKNITLVNDYDDEESYYEYTDITADVVTAYNAVYNAKLTSPPPEGFDNKPDYGGGSG
jgi:hypothetical protein